MHGQNYYLVQDIDQICSIEIVSVGELSLLGEHEDTMDFVNSVQTTICVVEDIENFCKDFKRLKSSWTVSNVYPVPDNVVAIKFIHLNGEFALVHHDGASIFRDGYFYYENGTHAYDEKKFDALIAKYMDTAK
jgi:hypothetical protein